MNLEDDDAEGEGTESDKRQCASGAMCRQQCSPGEPRTQQRSTPPVSTHSASQAVSAQSTRSTPSVPTDQAVVNENTLSSHPDHRSQ